MTPETAQALAAFSEEQRDFLAYLADPYTVGSDEDTDVVLEHLQELYTRAARLAAAVTAEKRS
jgi:hypothetical protein